MAVAGLVLAAGAGTRMGGPKALLVDGSGTRWVDRAVRVLAEGGCHPVIVVLGAAVTDVPGAIVTVADDWAEGMGASLRAGLATLGDTAPDATAAVVALVDQPDLTPDAVGRVAAASTRDVAAVATYDGSMGHPISLGRAIWDDVAATAVGDAGARHWLRSHPDRLVAVPCDGLGSARDVDSPQQ